MADKESPGAKRSKADYGRDPIKELETERITQDKAAVKDYEDAIKERRMFRKLDKARAGGGSGGVGVSDTREMQLGAELDPKAMMKREGMKKGGTVRTASQRADGIAIRGKTRA